MKLVVIPLFAVFLLVAGGCAKTTPSSHSQTDSTPPTSSVMNQEELKTEQYQTVEIYKYRSDSKKAQPEIINTLSETSDRQKVTTWIASINDKEVQLPSTVQSMYLLQLNFKEGASSKPLQQIAYAKDSQQNIYAKMLPIGIDFNLETFTEQDMAPLIKKLNSSSWHAAGRLFFIDPS